VRCGSAFIIFWIAAVFTGIASDLRKRRAQTGSMIARRPMVAALEVLTVLGAAVLSMLFLFLQTKLVVDYVSTCRTLLGVY
jgi:hypothetical protein